jgi:hypothetical protein
MSRYVLFNLASIAFHITTMKKISSVFAVLMAVVILIGGTPAEAQTATLTAADQNRLNIALAQLDATLGIVRIRLAENTLAASQRTALSGTLSSIRNTLGSLSLALSAPANSNIARSPSTGIARSPVAVSQPQAQAEPNAQSTEPAPIENSAPAPITAAPQETQAVTPAPSFLSSLLTSTLFWVGLAVIALVAFGAWAVRSAGSPRTAYASRREEDEEGRM